MGFEIELFAHPERISSQLICPICTSVLERPVQTPSEHMFCEDELLEWMTRSLICPVTNTKLDPDTIKKPGRIIMNMLAELEMYCPNRIHGCQWIGSCDQVTNHKKKCNNRSKDELLQEIETKDKLIAKLKQKLSASQERNSLLVESNEELQSMISAYDRRLKVYDAFFRNDDKEHEDMSTPSSAVQQLARLRRLNLIEEKMDELAPSSSQLTSPSLMKPPSKSSSKLVEILSADSKE